MRPIANINLCKASFICEMKSVIINTWNVVGIWDVTSMRRWVSKVLLRGFLGEAGESRRKPHSRAIVNPTPQSCPSGKWAVRPSPRPFLSGTLAKRPSLLKLYSPWKDSKKVLATNCLTLRQNTLYHLLEPHMSALQPRFSPFGVYSNLVLELEKPLLGT